MADIKYFSFTAFKSAMEVNDIDEATYSFILRAVFRYIKQKYGIDVEATKSFTVSVGSTTSSIVVPLTTDIIAGQLADNEHDILTVANDTVALTTTFTVSPVYATIPSTVSIQTTILPYDIQYAIYQHTKFLFESQKRNTNIIETATDATGNKVSYKTVIPSFISSVYREYSPNAVAFI